MKQAGFGSLGQKSAVVKIAEFIKKRLDESPNDPEALDYLNRFKLADEKIAQLEEKDNEYKEKAGRFNYPVVRQPEGIAITKELKAAKAAKVNLSYNISAKIKAKSTQ